MRIPGGLVLAAAAAAVVPILSTAPAQADPRDVIVTVTVGSGWHRFSWGEEGNPEPLFQVTTHRRMRITVTDVGCRGEIFTVFRGSTILAQTPSVPLDLDCEPPVATDPAVAVKDPSYSHLSFVVPPGRYTLRIGLPFNFFREGEGYIRFDRAPCHT